VRLRHAVTLSLLGWYLLLAPLRAQSIRARTSRPTVLFASDVLNLKAPLSKWQKKGIFDSERDCSNERRKLYNQQLADFRQATEPREKRNLSYEMFRSRHAKCVASDDPRFTE
jgi:hypothetical protein